MPDGSHRIQTASDQALLSSHVSKKKAPGILLRREWPSVASLSTTPPCIAG